MLPSSTPPAVARALLRPTVLLLGLVLAVSAAYHNALSGPFLLDDEASILENESLADLTRLSAVLWPRTEVFTAGRPLLNLSFALNYAWGGTNPFGYHVVNVAIHLIAALTLFGIVRRTLLLPRFAARFSSSGNWIAFGSALLWALHPLQTESVTYVSQRAESLMGLCYLGTLYGFIRALERPNAWLLPTVAVCAAGMMVKEVMVTAPLMVFLFDCTLVAGSPKEAWDRRRRLYVGLASTWILLGTLMVMTRLHDRGIGYDFAVAWHEYLRIECGAVLHYLRLALVPFPLVFDYGDNLPLPSLAILLFQAAILGSLAVVILLALRNHRALGFLGCWFFIILAPTSSIVPVAGQPLAENRVYLSLAAGCVLFMVGLTQWLGRRSGPVLLLVAMALGWITVRRNLDYQSELAIWQDTLGQRPTSARAHNYYGNALLRAGRAGEATGHLEAAIKIQPTNVNAYMNLGSAHLAQQRIDEAIRNYGIALQLKPNNPIALTNLGTALFQAGRKPEALQYYQAALRVNPDYVSGQLNLGVTLGHLGRWDEAIAIFEDVLRRYPKNQFARDNLQQLRGLRERPPPTPVR